MFFEKTGPVWETLHELERRLKDTGIEYVVVGGLALNVYNYPRQTVDVDIVLRSDDYQRFNEVLVGTVYEKATGGARRFVDPTTEVSIDVLISGQLAGHTGKNPSVCFPDPNEGEIQGGLRTVSLARLIELKLVTWRYKDWGDVVELIRRNNLAESLADRLDPITRSAYKECFDQANDPEYGV